MVALNKSSFAIAGAIIVVGIAVYLIVDAVRPKTPDWVTATVERGDVSEIVSVSGYVEAKNTANLAFPSSGTVTEVFVKEGQQVVQGEVLATLGSSQLVARKKEVQAGLRVAEAAYDQLIAGADTTDRTVAAISVKNAEQELARVISIEKEKVANARKSLLSNDLEALSTDPDEEAPAPVVTGTYSCTTEGSYTLDVYSSGGPSGYSYRFSGLETGTASVSTDQPAALGSCGLFVQFTGGNTYQNSKWTIDIPNKRSSSYVAYKNALSLAQETEANAKASAEDTLALTREESAGVTALPRSEEIEQKEAAVEQARARVTEIDALLEDRSVVAPFDGTVTSVDILKGETAQADPVITLLAADAFELKARIPEIDITKLQVGQKVETNFDAMPNSLQIGTISYISPLAVMIDGVAYFEATIELTDMPTWMRSGLNADVAIIIDKKENVLRVPKRYVTEHADGTYSVLQPQGTKSASTTIEVAFSGNDGFIEITGLNEGDIVIAP
jgi:HlyD family secretion protein